MLTLVHYVPRQIRLLLSSLTRVHSVCFFARASMTKLIWNAFVNATDKNIGIGIYEYRSTSRLTILQPRSSKQRIKNAVPSMYISNTLPLSSYESAYMYMKIAIIIWHKQHFLKRSAHQVGQADLTLDLAYICFHTLYMYV